MRHSVAGYKLSRSKNERRRLLQGLAREMIAHGSITTTGAKAHAVQPLIEKLISKAKKGSSGAVQEIKKTLADWQSTKTLLAEAKTRFSSRSSGFTRIIKLGRRRGDNTQEVKLSFVDPRVTQEPKTPKTQGKKKK